MNKRNNLKTTAGGWSNKDLMIVNRKERAPWRTVMWNMAVV